MRTAKWHEAVGSHRVLPSFRLSLCLILLCVFPSLVVSQDATLNDPGSATGTGASGGSNSSAASPATTSTAPLSLSPQRVPYLLNQPSINSKTKAGRGAYFTGCSDSSSVGYVAGMNQINISSVYTQFDKYTGDNVLGNGQPYTAGSLRIVGVGTLGNESYAFNSFTDSTGVTRGLLSAIQVSTRFSTFEFFSNYTYLCDRLYPTQNDSRNPNVRPSSCQFGPGTVAFGVDIPLNSTYDAGTLMTQIRLTDSSSPALTISCIEVRVSPYRAQRWFWSLLFWFPLAIAIGLSVLSFFARLITAETAQRKAFKNRAREGGAPRFLQGRLTPMLVAAISGRDLVMNAGLVRFITPGCWDIIFTLQYFVAIAMCHVQWPDFAYPFLRQAAWSTLLGNVTLTQPAELRIDPLATNATLPSGAISDQMNDSNSPLYMNSTQSNSLLDLGGDEDGIITFAKMVGLQPQNLFGTCLGIWLIIVAIIVVASVLCWVVDYISQAQDRVSKRKEGIFLPEPLSNPSISLMNMEKGKSLDSTKGRASIAATSSPRNSLTLGSSWSSATGLHGKALHGNLIRALLLFHLPITIFSTYQFASTRNHSSTSIGLAALSFTVLSLLLPVYILTRIALTPLQRLYEHLGTLLALGPAYYLYSPGSQLFCAVSIIHSFVLGVVVGAGQGSGTAQASVILVVEILAALASTLWLPWSEGAMMGPLSFMTNVLRIIMAILLLMLTESVGFGYGARTWLTYVILLLQGIYLLGALLVFIVKFIEAVIRLVWRVAFDERVSTRTAGLAGAIRKIQRRKTKGQTPPRRRPDPYANLQAQKMKLQQRMSSASTSTAAPMLANSQSLSIQMSNSRSANYAEYLGGGARMPTNPMMEENGPIMAALPPVSMRTPDSRPVSMAGGFVRVGGGRATEENPYSTRPTIPLSPSFNSTPGAGGAAARLQSQAGPQRTWGVQRNSTINPDNSYFALAKTPSHELSSTQAAALAASRSLAVRQNQTPVERRNLSPNAGVVAAAPSASQPQKLTSFKRLQELDEDWSDEEGTTWDSNAVARGKGAWSGVAKMSAALNNFKRIVAGNKPLPVDTEEDVGETLPPTASGGFEVVRPNRPVGKPVNADSSSQGINPANTPFKPMMSGVTSPPRQIHDSAQQYSDTTIAPTIKAIPATPTPEEKRSSSPPPLIAPVIDSAALTSRGPLGMLAADVHDTTSSAGHAEEEEAAAATEERFWLPPLNLQQEDSLL